MRNSLRTMLLSVAAVTMILVNCGLVHRLGTTGIAAIKENPRKYVGSTVTVKGEVTERMNLLALKYFRIKDATGDIFVVTDRVLPVEGTDVRVTGKVEELSIGPWQGLVISEARIATERKK